MAAMDHEEPGEYTPEELERLKRIEEELEKIGHTHFAEPSEAGHDAKLRDIEERARAARSKQASVSSNTGLDAESSRSTGVGLTAAYGIIGLPLVGAGLGWLADRAMGTGFCIVAGVVLGLVGGMYYAVQISNRN